MKVLHLWENYSPNLFDKSHPLCLQHKLDSEVVCSFFIENGAKPLLNTYALRHQKPSEMNSIVFRERVHRYLRRPIDRFRFAKMVRRRVASFNPDLLHVHFGTTAAELLRWGGLPKKPMVVSFYGVDASASLTDPKIIQKYTELFARDPVIHVLSEEVAERMVNHGCPRDLIVVGNLPASIEKIPKIGSEYTGVTRYLIPARFVEKKGHLILLSAFKRLIETRENVKLTCFGYGPSKWLVDLVTDMGMDGVVDVVDNGQSDSFIEMYIDMLRKHDVILAPSIRSSTGDDEGGPALTLIMAQAAEKPVIVSDFPGSERSVSNGVEGRVVPSGNAEALYLAMLEMEGNLSEWKKLGLLGYSRVVTDFSEREYWHKLLQWYERSLEKAS